MWSFLQSLSRGVAVMSHVAFSVTLFFSKRCYSLYLFIFYCIVLQAQSQLSVVSLYWFLSLQSAASFRCAIALSPVMFLLCLLVQFLHCAVIALCNVEVFIFWYFPVVLVYCCIHPLVLLLLCVLLHCSSRSVSVICASAVPVLWCYFVPCCSPNKVVSICVYCCIFIL